MRLLFDSEVRDLLSAGEAVEIARRALLDWAAHEDVNRPRQRVYAGRERLSVHAGAYTPSRVLGVAMHGETVAVSGSQQKTLHYPPCVLVFGADRRELLALIVGRSGAEGDLGTLNRLRAAAISAVGTQACASSESRRLALFGSGRQAREHLLSHLAVLPRLATVRIYSPNPDHRERFALEARELVVATGSSCEVAAAGSPGEALEGAEVVVAATNTTEPVFDGHQLGNRVHVTSIAASNVGLLRSGIVSRMRRELDDVTLRRASRVVILSAEQARQDEQGEVVGAVDRGAVDWDRFVELREVLQRAEEGGRADLGAEGITVFLNNAGTGNVDVALAGRLFEKAVERGLGVIIDHEDAQGERGDVDESGAGRG